MAENNFILNLIASLKKGESKKQIQSDIREIGDIKIPLIGTLSKSKTRKQIKEDANNLGVINTPIIGKLNKSKTKAQIKKDLESTNGTVKLTGKVDSKDIATSVKQATTQAQKVASSRTVDIDVAFTVKKEKLINDIKLLGQQNSRLFKDTDMSIKYNTLLDNAEMAKNTVELSILRTQLGSLRSELKVTKNAGLTMTDALKNGLFKVLQLFGGHGIIMQFTAQLRNAWKEAKELDTAMTDLSRVNSEITRSGFPDYLDRVIGKTKELSVATKDYINAVTTFSRAGYNLADSEILASMAVQLEKVGDMSAEAASKSLLSGLQAYTEIDGYGMDQLAEKAQALNDKIDLIGNTASITQAEVASGIQAVGSVMNEANTSVDEFISLLAAGNRSVQDSNKVALAIRTSALRIRSCTAELEDMGEATDNVIESTADLAKQIKALTNIDGSGGVNILEADEETFRSIYDIYNDIAKVYDKMSDTNASALLDLIAGKNRSNQVSAILKNMSEANELLEKSLSATGTASAEYEIYLNSAEAATERFGVAMTETYSNIIGGETVKGLTNAATAVLDFANKFGLVETSLKGFLALGILKGITTLSVAFKNSAIQVSNYGTALNAVKDISTYANDTEKYANAMKDLKNSCSNLTDAQLKQVLVNRNLSDSQLIEILQLKDLDKEEQVARLSQLGLVTATEEQITVNGAATLSTFSLKAAMKGLKASIMETWAAMSALQKASIIITGISIAWNVISSVMDSHNQKLAETRQKAAELAEEYARQQSSLNSQIEKYKELKESLDSGNLSTDEARSIKEQLLEIQNSLVDSYGTEASNIDLVNGKYKEQLGLLSELSKEKAKNFITENEDIYKKAKTELEKIREYDLGQITNWSNLYPKTEEQQALLDFIRSYSDLFEITEDRMSDGEYSYEARNLKIYATVEDADDVMHKFAEDLRKYAEKNAIDVSGILESIPEQIRKTQTDELKEYKSIYDEYMKAAIVSDDKLRPLYQQSIEAVQDYNNALSSGEGITEAKANLDSLQQSVQDATVELEGSQAIFDSIFEGVNKNAEAAYQLSQAFENDSTIQKYAEQLRGLSDIDIKAIKLDNENIEKGEEAFRGLLETLGYTEPTEEQIQSLIDKLVELGYVVGETKNIKTPYEIFATFTDSDFGTRIQHITDLFNEGTISHKEYFEALQSEINNFDASNFTNSIEDMDKASAQFFVDSMQQAADGLSGLINSFDKGEMSISEYLEGYLAIGNTLSTLTDNLQENSAAWNEHGEAISEVGNTALDDTQNKLSSAMSIIKSYQDSIYSLEQIMNDAVTVGSDEFTAHANVIAEDLYRIVQTGGMMADTIASTLGTTTSEIAQSLTENVSNQEIACQAIMANTNNAITDMASSIGNLFDTLGDAISNFKVDLSFGVKSIDWKKVNVLGAELSLPEIKFELGASGESLDKIGSALSSFGKTIASNYTPQTIELEDFHFGSTDAAKDRKYSPSSGVTKNYEDALGRIKDATKSTSSAAKSEFSEMVDFFKRRIDELDDALSLLKTNLDNVSGSFAKNNLVEAQLNITEEKFNNYTDALAMYTQKANEALSKLPSDIATKVKDGAVALTDFIGDGNKDVVEAIKEYESWAGEIADCKQELAELQKEIRQLELSKFTNIMDDYQNQFNLRGNSKDLISKQIALLREAGELIGESFFKTQIDQSQKQLELLENEKAQLVNQMSSAISSGRIQKGTAEWLSMVDSLQSVDSSILDCKKSIEEFDNELLSLHTQIFDRIQEQFSNLNSEISNIIDLFDEFEVSDDKGIWSKEAIAQLGLLTQQYELAQYQVQQYNNEIDELNKQYLAGRYSATEYADKLADLNSKQWDAVKASESAKDALIDLNKIRVENQIKGIEKEIDAYDELTQAQIKALKASKDLHDYENSIAEKTKSITNLEHQIAAMANDTSAATVAKRKKLEEQLAEAKKDLEETQYQHSIEVQEDALNKQFEDYEATRNKEIDALRESLNDKETILATSFETVKNNASLVGQEIATIATEHGVTVSNALISSWQSGETAIASYGQVLSLNTSAFIGNIMGVENEVWNLQAQANVTADSLAWMFSTKADNLVNELTTSYYAEANLTYMTDVLQQSLVNTLERGYDVSSIVNSLASVESAANSAKAAIDRMNSASSASTNTASKNLTGTSKTSSNNSSGTYAVSPMSGKVLAGPSLQANSIDPKLKKYASGTRNSKGGIIIKDEEGFEAQFRKLSEGKYALANEGDQVFTKEQTDRLYELANTDNRNLLPVTEENLRKVFDVGYKARVPEPVIDRRMPAQVTIDNRNIFNGDINDLKHLEDQMQKIADKSSLKATDKGIKDFTNKLYDGIKYRRY